MITGPPEKPATEQPLLSGDGMRPVLIVPPESMSAEDVARLNANGICTVVCKDPGAVKFLDPIPAMAGRTKAEEAAIQLSRRLLNWKWLGNSDLNKDYRLTRQDICQLYVDVLVHGTPLSLEPTPEELRMQREAKVEAARHQAKMDEAWKIGREEARAERAAKKAAEEAAKGGKKDDTKTKGK